MGIEARCLHPAAAMADPSDIHAPRRLKVALVVASLRILGGHSVQAQRLLDGWSNDPDVEAWIVPVDPIPPAPFDRLLRIKFVRTIVTQLLYWPLLVRELRRAHVVHVFSAAYASFLLAPLPAVIVAKLLGKPVLLNYHSAEAPDHLARSGIARFVLTRVVDANVVPSSFLREVFARFGIRAAIVPNSIDTSRFRYRERDPLRPRLLSTRNLENLYNVACTLRACSVVQARYPEATLTVVGYGSQAAALRALATELGLRGVTFAGRVPADQMPRYYDEADIYIQSPAIDNMPLSVLEAFASGLPVVSTGIGGVPAILTDGVHGLLAPENDERALATHILTLLERPDHARAMARAAHATCRHYEWGVVRAAWLAAYRRLARGGASRCSPVAHTDTVRSV
jgi:L-malate glycosyltransferase